MSKKTGFILHYDMLENLINLGSDTAMEVLNALSLHDQGKSVGPLSPTAQFAFNAYKATVDSAKLRWEAQVNNGKKRQRKDEPTSASSSQDEPTSAKPSQQSATAGVNDLVIVNDHDLVKESCGSCEPPSPPLFDLPNPETEADSRPIESSAENGGNFTPDNKSETPQNERGDTADTSEPTKSDVDTFSPDFGPPRASPPGFAPETSLVPSRSRAPPARAGKNDLTEEQRTLFHAAVACFESCEKTKAMMYQDRQSTARYMANVKLFVTRCANIAPGFSADFMRGVLEHFQVMCGGRLKGKASFTPNALMTGWIWEQVVDSLPEAEPPEFLEAVRGIFK